MHSVAADLVMTLHLLFVVFAVLGGLWVWRRPKVAWWHLPALVWAIVVVVTDWTCPLTPLEQGLRLAAGEAGYEGGFIAHYILPVLYPEGLTDAGRRIGMVVVVLLNTACYAAARARHRKALH